MASQTAKTILMRGSVISSNEFEFVWGFNAFLVLN